MVDPSMSEVEEDENDSVMRKEFDIFWEQNVGTYGMIINSISKIHESYAFDDVCMQERTSLRTVITTCKKRFDLADQSARTSKYIL